MPRRNLLPNPRVALTDWLPCNQYHLNQFRFNRYLVNAAAINQTTMRHFANQPRAIANAHRQRPDSYACIDFETTGGDPSNGIGVREAAVVVVKKGVVQKQCHWFLDPHYPMKSGMKRIYGRPDVNFFVASSFRPVLEQMVKIVGGLPVLAHNAAFERRFISYFSSLYRLPFAPFYIDSLDLTKKVFPKQKNHRLGDLCAAMALKQPKVGEFHNALFDAQMTVELWQRTLRHIRAHERITGAVTLSMIEYIQRGKNHRRSIYRGRPPKDLYPTGLQFPRNNLSVQTSTQKAKQRSSLIQETHSLAILRQELRTNNKRILFLFDIDNVCLKPSQTLGGDAWFKMFCRKYGFKEALKTYCQIQQTTAVEPVEAILPRLLRKLQQHPRACIMGLTSRGAAMACLTHQQLAKVGVTMNPHRKFHRQKFGQHGELIRGVTFTSGKCKGAALDRLLRYFEKADLKFDRVVFVDDELHKLQAVMETCQEWSIEFRGYRYSRMDHGVNLNPQVTELQLQLFQNKLLLRDDEAEHLAAYRRRQDPAASLGVCEKGSKLNYAEPGFWRRRKLK